MDRVAILLIGILTGALLMLVMEADADEEKPVYVLVSAAPKSEPEELRAYAEAAGPLARAAGLEILAHIPSVPDELVLEGSWPHTGGITIEKFESMAVFHQESSDSVCRSQVV